MTCFTILHSSETAPIGSRFTLKIGRRWMVYTVGPYGDRLIARRWRFRSAVDLMRAQGYKHSPGRYVPVSTTPTIEQITERIDDLIAEAYRSDSYRGFLDGIAKLRMDLG